MAPTRTAPQAATSPSRPATPAGATVLVAHRPADDDIAGRPVRRPAGQAVRRPAGRAVRRPTGKRRAGAGLTRMGGAATGLLLAVAFAAGVVAIVAGLSGWRAMTVRSASMAPTLRQGDLIVVGPVRAAAVRAGQVVTFRDPRLGDRVLTQRVVSVRLVGSVERFETAGDAQATTERWTMAPYGLLGREVVAIPAVGGLIGDLASRNGLLGAAGAAGAALLLVWRRRRRSV